MRKDLKANAYIYPLPVLIVGTYNEDGVPCAMNAAWGTVCDTKCVSICLAFDHKTTKNILRDKCFSVSIADCDNVIPADYVGIVSANDEPNKIEKTGWTAIKGSKVNAPIFEQLPLALECKLVSYDEQSEVCIGEVVNVSVDEKIINEKGKITLEKFKPICYDCGEHGYYSLGERVGSAFKDGKKIK